MTDLFVLSLGGARLTWSAPAFASAPLAPRRAPAAARSLTGDPLSVVADGRTATGETVTFAAGLAEETQYPVLLQSLAGEPVALVHADPVATAGLTVGDAGRVVHGRIRTGAHAGRTVFTVVVGGRPVAEIALVVAPTKLPWAAVEAMRDEVEAAGAGLAIAAIRPATGGVAPTLGHVSAPGWLAVAEASVADAERAVEKIGRRPVGETVREVVPVRLSTVGRGASSETRRALSRGGAVPSHVPARPAVATLDTPAHRWLAASVATAAHTASRLAREESAGWPSLRRDATRDRLDRVAARLRRLGTRAPLAEADASRAPAVPPLSLRQRPVYADAYRALRRLSDGLALRGGALDVAWQSLDTLYEMWTALTVVRVAAEAVGAPMPSHPFGVAREGTRVALKSGRRHRVRLDGPRGRIDVTRQPSFGGTVGAPALVRQRPDLFLDITPGRGAVRRVVLDAKYRRVDDAATVARYGTAAPPADALGALHRYRDAIRGPAGEADWVADAVALFPSADARWRDGRLWASVTRTGVGAVGLAPGHDEELRALFERWLG